VLVVTDQDEVDVPERSRRDGWSCCLCEVVVRPGGIERGVMMIRRPPMSMTVVGPPRTLKPYSRRWESITSYTSAYLFRVE
jgi:hypothetical protein